MTVQAVTIRYGRRCFSHERNFGDYIYLQVARRVDAGVDVKDAVVAAIQAAVHAICPLAVPTPRASLIAPPLLGVHRFGAAVGRTDDKGQDSGHRFHIGVRVRAFRRDRAAHIVKC
jgi:hypothetical protein